MVRPKKIIYAGESFRLQSTGRYYQSGRKDAQERLLHRRVWVDHHGAIPDGFHVHHKDGDWGNNSINNLELVDAKQHLSQHTFEKMSNLEFRGKALAALDLARDAAAAWHGSEDGIAWHREHGVRTWEGRQPVEAVCSVCSGKYETFFPGRSRFCSRSCEQKEGYQRHKTATGSCVMCGKEFSYNKFRSQECCSRDCANKLRGLRSQGLQPDA